MNVNEYIDYTYNNILCDFTDASSCNAWRQAHDNIAYPDTPFFSFMMTIYNDDKLINSSINSLLKQSYTNWELIVLDNSDKNDNVWKMLENAMYADKRIHAIKSTQSVGWAKGASICLKHAHGIYTTFLAADDCIDEHALIHVFKILEPEMPDILWVGVCATEQNEKGNFAEVGCRIPNKKIWCCDSEKSRIHTIAEIMKDIYYNSFFHYMNISFLKRHNIDFFEPYYGDCGGMTEAMIHAEKMIAIDNIIYFLTQNTSQTIGWWLNDIVQSRTAIQWKGIKSISSQNDSNLQDDLHYISRRLMKNVIAEIPALCAGRCRDKYMNPVQVTGADIINQLETLLFCDEIAEMLSLSYELFPYLLKAMASISNSEYSFEIEKSPIAPLLRLAIYENHYDLKQQLNEMVSWLVCKENPYYVGFDYFCLLLRQSSYDIKKEYIALYKDIAKKHKEDTHSLS
ncbi:MAG: glycosyltransferase [Clostridium sp.]|nr:glycosyltransferase [Clostridium sp.]MCM1207415.1 glycosyltransferase [Ruminococcus sp.]